MLGELGTKKEELDQEHKMRNLLTIEPAGNKLNTQEFCTCTKNLKTRTINEIHNLRNNKKIVKKFGTTIDDLRHGFRVQKPVYRNRNKNRNNKQIKSQEQKWKNYELGTKI